MVIFNSRSLGIAALCLTPSEFTRCLLRCPWRCLYYGANQATDQLRVFCSDMSRYLKAKHHCAELQRNLLASISSHMHHAENVEASSS